MIGPFDGLKTGGALSEQPPDFVWERGVAGRSKLTLVSGKTPQLRKSSAKNWTKAKEREFLSVLAETCNVTRACDAAKVSVTHAYRMRQSNAAFRAAWRDAIGSAYHRLELVLLDRAFNGTEKVVQRRDGSEERMREYSNQLGLTLLKMHRDTAVEMAAEAVPQDSEEMRERLVGKLLRLKKRIEADAAKA